jgi:exodeoxyribonuclease-5
VPDPLPIAIRSPELTAEQRQAVDRLVSFPRPVRTLGGYAGTGKSTVVAVLRRLLRGFAVCAFTGKAANVLRNKGVPASTIHSLIYRAEEVAWVDDGGRRLTSATFRPKLPRDVPCRGFIVDEASMVGRRLHDDLCSYGRPLIFVGVHGQLESVGDSGFGLLLRPDVTLETVHRNAGEVAHFADFVRRGYNPANWREHRLCSRDAVRFQTLADLGEGFDRAPDQCICAFNFTRLLFNRLMREHRGYPADRPVKGDRVMCLQNDHRLGVFNGMQGDVIAVSADQMVFRSAGKDYRVRFIPEAFNGQTRAGGRDRGGRLPFDYAYCVTCHKAQGDEWDNVLVFEQRCRRWDHARWAYTAASRARRRLIWVTMGT